MSELVHAPFTGEQVQSLNGYQCAGCFHPFTCGNDDCDGDGLLVATTTGWYCPSCDYRQDWAHSFMADGSWKAHPLSMKSDVDRVLESVKQHAHERRVRNRRVLQTYEEILAAEVERLRALLALGPSPKQSPAKDSP